MALIGNRNAQSSYELDATDMCIIACSHCYKKELLVGCANNCLFTEGLSDTLWKANCPFLLELSDLPEAKQILL